MPKIDAVRPHTILKKKIEEIYEEQEIFTKPPSFMQCTVAIEALARLIDIPLKEIHDRIYANQPQPIEK